MIPVMERLPQVRFVLHAFQILSLFLGRAAKRCMSAAKPSVRSRGMPKHYFPYSQRVVALLTILLFSEVYFNLFFSSVMP